MRLIYIFIGITACVVTAAGEHHTVYPGKSWLSKRPAEVNLHEKPLNSLREYLGGRGCVVRRGYMVYHWGDIAKRADVASACKPWFVHFLLLLLQQGALDLDEPVHKWEPGLASLNAAREHKDRDITWRHLANQTSCYGVQERPGQAYDYSDFNMALFADTLFLKVYKTSREKIDREVLHAKLTNILECEDEPTFLAFGTGNRPGRLAISVRDFARLGLLYLNQGRWKDQQLLSEKLCSLATKTPISNAIPRTNGKAAEMLAKQRSLGGGNNQTDHLGSYSFAWWTNGVDRAGRRHWPDAPLDTFAALGHGGKRAVVIIPSLELVVSWNDTRINGREMENQALKLLALACKQGK